MKHQHHNQCDHLMLYCVRCDTAYCNRCNREWYNQVTYTNPYWTTTTTAAGSTTDTTYIYNTHAHDTSIPEGSTT